MNTLSKKIESLWILLIITLQKMEDNAFRLIRGLPNLKRSQITANLFLGSQYNLIGLERLRKLGVTAIVNMRETSVYSEARYQGFRYLHIPTPDNTPPPLADLLRGSAFIDEEIRVAGGKVYIHCRQGLGRGPTMTIAYLIRIGTTYDDALALVKKVRPFINPTPVQRIRLHEFETYCKQHSGVIFIR